VEARELGDAVRRIVERLKPAAIVLFGSRARGDWGPWSDYDLLVIADFRESYLERVGKLIELLKDVRIPIEPHPYTLEEAISMLHKGNPTIVDALEEGVFLHLEPGAQRLLKEYHRLKSKGLKRTKTTIVVPRNECQ